MFLVEFQQRDGLVELLIKMNMENDKALRKTLELLAICNHQYIFFI